MTRQPSAWRDAAACKGMDPELFVGPDLREGIAARRMREKAALAVCGTCPVSDECLAAAEFEHDTDAVRGATTPRQRRTSKVA